MAQKDGKIAPSGLWTAPAAILAPTGALQDAEEVVSRKPGLLEPRPGFSSAETFSHTAVTVRRLLERVTADAAATSGSDIIAVGPDPGAPPAYTARHMASPSSSITDQNGAQLQWQADTIRGANVRGNLFVTTADGPRKIDSSNTALRAGLPKPAVSAVVASTGAGNYAIQANKYVTYRAVRRYTDSQGLVILSGVSGRAAATSSSAASVTVTVITDPNDDVRTDGVIEIYRTFNGDTYPPTDEHFFVGEVAVSTLSSSKATFTDNLPDDQLGDALYINASELGAEADHIRPPTAGCMAMFNGSLFLGDLTYEPSLILRWDAAGRTGQAAGVGVRGFTGTFTNGSPTISSVNDTTGIKVGMILQNTALEYASNATYITVTAVTSTTITASQNYVGSTGSKTRAAIDSIRIGSKYFPAYGNGPGAMVDPFQTFVAAVRGVDVLAFTNGTDSQIASADATADLIDGVLFDSSGGLSGSVVVRGLSANQNTAGSFTIYATHGSQYSPALPEPTATGTTVSQTHVPNGLAWSNDLEPDHFTGVNTDTIAPVGRIMNMVALGNALLVFLNTGIWRVSGSGADSGFRFDQHDQDFRLLAGDAVTRLRDLVYAWGDKGVVACDENSATPLSPLALKDRLDPVQRLIGAGSRTAFGAWACTNRKDEEVVFSVPSTNPSNVGYGERLYVYNILTQAWTNWLVSRQLRHGVCAYDSNGALALFIQDDVNTRTERSILAGYSYTADDSFTGNASVSGAAMHITSGSWSPTIGDLVLDAGGNPFLVIAVTDSTHVTLDASGYSGSIYTAYIAFTSKMTPIAATAEAPGVTKNWGESVVWWGSLKGLRQYDISCTSALSATAVSQTRVVSDSRISNDRAESLRFTVPRNHARTTRLYPSLLIRQGGSTWRYEGINPGYQIMGDRVLRRR